MSNAEFNQKATRGFAWNYLYKISEFGLINLYTIIVVRKFGPEISAPYAVFTALATTLTMLGAFAVDGILLRYIQRIRLHPSGDEERFDRIESLSLPHFLSTLLAFRLMMVTAVSIIVAMIFIGLPHFVPSLNETFGLLQTYTPHLIVFLFGQSLNSFSTFSLTGLLETKRVFIVSIVSRLSLLSVGLWLLFSESLTLSVSISVFAGATLLCGMLMYLMLQLEVRNQLRNAPISKGNFHIFHALSILWKFITGKKKVSFFLTTPLLIYGMTTWGNDILSTVLGRQPDILMMRAMLGEHSAQIGYYFTASQVILVTEYLFLFGLGGTLVSIFSKIAHDDEQRNNGKYEGLSKARREIAGFQNVLLIPLCSFMYFFISPIIQSVYGIAFAEAASMVKVGLIAMIIAVGAFGGGMQITSLVSIGKERLVFRNRLTWGIINVIGNFILIYFLGGVGAIIGTQYCNVGACASEAYFSNKYIGKSMNYLSTLRILMIATTSALTAFAIYQMIGSTFSTLPSVLIAGGIDAVIVLFLYWIFKVPELNILTNRLQKLFPALMNKI